MYYINLFFLFSILGHLLETLLIKSEFTSGIMFGWWTPVYGIGAIVITLIYKFLTKHVKKEGWKAFFLFILSAIILTFMEFSAGMIIEKVFNKIFWNYEPYRYNLGKYISLETAGVWAISSIVLIYILKPFLDKIIEKIPKWITWILIILFVVDLVLTIALKVF